MPTSLRDLPADLSADVCIIGSGPAGATLARELAGHRLDILLLESGGLEYDPAAETLNEIESVGAPRILDQTIIRNRGLGGTARIWTGRCTPLDDIDHETRPWVCHSGWPIGPETLKPFLARARPYLGLAAPVREDADDLWAYTGLPAPPTRPDPALFLPCFWQFSRGRHPAEPVRIRDALLADSGHKLRIVTDATVTRLIPNREARAIAGVEAATPESRRHRIRARLVVLAAGGIENARLLLASRDVCAAGLGNARGLVGRFLMDHVRGGIAVFRPRDAGRLAPHFATRLVRGPEGTHLFSQGWRLSPALQAREGLLNGAFWLSELVSPQDPWSALKRLASGLSTGLADAARIAAHPVLLARGLWSSLGGSGAVPRRLAGLELNAMIEQVPDPESRVTLAERCDRHGVPLPRLDWRIDPAEPRTLRIAAERIRPVLSALGLPVPALADWVRAGDALPPDFADVSHHIGTTRMAADPARGVVDLDGQVHGVEGLYVAGSSVFPTGGHANPTLTIVALAIRLADHLAASASRGRREALSIAELG